MTPPKTCLVCEKHGHVGVPSHDREYGGRRYCIVCDGQCPGCREYDPTNRYDCGNPLCGYCTTFGTDA